MKRPIKAILTTLSIALLCGALAFYIALPYCDYVLVKNSDFFAIGGVGYAGQEPAVSKAFRRLQLNPLAGYLFIRLGNDGTSAAKAYAVVGLMDINPQYANDLIARYQEAGETYIAYYGCIRTTDDFSRLSDIIQSP